MEVDDLEYDAASDMYIPIQRSRRSARATAPITYNEEALFRRSMYSSDEEEEDSDSDSMDSGSDEEGRRKRREKRKARKKSSRESGKKKGRGKVLKRGRKKKEKKSLRMSEEQRQVFGLRSSSRRASSKVVSYAEDDMLSGLDTSEEEEISRIEKLKKAEQEAKPLVDEPDILTVDEVLDYNPDEGTFLIKLKGMSYRKIEWIAFEDLMLMSGKKKVENFQRKFEEFLEWKESANPEDVEAELVVQEMDREMWEQFKVAERVVASRLDSEGDEEYLVKWNGAGYDLCTWEKPNDLVDDQQLIDQYLDPDASTPAPYTRFPENLQKHPENFSPFTEQPFWLQNGKLRDYQLAGLNWLSRSWCLRNNVILADEMGLGKTLQTTSLLGFLSFEQNIKGPFLVVVPLSTLPAWKREIEKWIPSFYVVDYVGDSKCRRIIQEYEIFEGQRNRRRKYRVDVLLTTFDFVIKDKSFLSSIRYKAMCVDEAHRLKNDDSRLFETLREFHADYKMLITGTPIQNSLRELWALLYFLDPHKFPSADKFEEEFGNTEEQQNLLNLHQALTPHLLRRTKKEVEKSLPAKNERILRVDMCPLQKRYYRYVLTRNYKQLSKASRGPTSSLLNVVMELKKVCNHPYLFMGAVEDAWELYGESGERQNHVTSGVEHPELRAIISASGKMVLMDKLLLRLRETGHRVLIFSQMVRLLDVLSRYMVLRGFPFQRLDGSTNRLDRQRAMDHFNAPESKDFCFLLSTRAGGLGINLATADTVIIFDSDWNPQNDLQAESRAHRIGQKNVVNIYRLITRESVEENILERAKQKMILDHLVIQRMDTSGAGVLGDLLLKSSQPSGEKLSGLLPPSIMDTPEGADAASKLLAQAAASSSTGTSGGGGSGAGTSDFSKEELDMILRFGAENLFREDAEEESARALRDLDIDDILRRAEVTEDPSSLAVESATQELVKSFNVATFSVADETADDFWSKAIPEEDKKRVDEEEAAARAEEDAEILPIRLTRLQKLEASSSLEEEGSTNASSSGFKKALSEKQQRLEFTKSFRKFASPRLVAATMRDAGLEGYEEKMFSTLAENILREARACVAAEKELQDSAAVSSDAGEEGAQRGSVEVMIQGVPCRPRELLQRQHELEAALDQVSLYQEPKVQYRVRLQQKSSFKQPWSVEEDGHLVLGMLEYGFGSWHQIRTDPTLCLKDKKDLQGDKMRRRAEYLLKNIVQVQEQKSRRGGSCLTSPTSTTSSAQKRAEALFKKRGGVASSTSASQSLSSTVDSGVAAASDRTVGRSGGKSGKRAPTGGKTSVAGKKKQAARGKTAPHSRSTKRKADVKVNPAGHSDPAVQSIESLPALWRAPVEKMRLLQEENLASIGDTPSDSLKELIIEVGGLIFETARTLSASCKSEAEQKSQQSSQIRAGWKKVAAAAGLPFSTRLLFQVWTESRMAVPRLTVPSHASLATPNGGGSSTTGMTLGRRPPPPPPPSLGSTSHPGGGSNHSGPSPRGVASVRSNPSALKRRANAPTIPSGTQRQRSRSPPARKYLPPSQSHGLPHAHRDRNRDRDRDRDRDTESSYRQHHQHHPEHHHHHHSHHQHRDSHRRHRDGDEEEEYPRKRPKP